MKDYKRLTTRNDDGTWGVNYFELANEVVKWQEEHATQYLSTDLTNILGEKLTDLEDKIENGTLIELPCKVGDTVYELERYLCCDGNDYWEIEEETFELWMLDLLGKTIFLTKSEAEARLKELKIKYVF